MQLNFNYDDYDCDLKGGCICTAGWAGNLDQRSCLHFKLKTGQREPAFTCKRSGFVDNECCEPCDCADTRRIVDQYDEPERDAFAETNKIGSTLRIRLPNDYVIGVDHGKDGKTTVVEGRRDASGKLFIEKITQQSVRMMAGCIADDLTHLCDILTYTMQSCESKPITRWQRFKRRWSDRLERVADAWAVLRGKKQARDEDDY